MRVERQTKREVKKDLLPFWGVRAIKSAAALQGGSWFGIYSLHCPSSCHRRIRSSTLLTIPLAALKHTQRLMCTDTHRSTIIWNLLQFTRVTHLMWGPSDPCRLIIDSSAVPVFFRARTVKWKSVQHQRHEALIRLSVLSSPSLWSGSALKINAGACRKTHRGKYRLQGSTQKIRWVAQAVQTWTHAGMIDHTQQRVQPQKKEKLRKHALF